MHYARRHYSLLPSVEPSLATRADIVGYLFNAQFSCLQRGTAGTESPAAEGIGSLCLTLQYHHRMTLHSDGQRCEPLLCFLRHRHKKVSISQNTKTNVSGRSRFEPTSVWSLY